jgi:hypothetical protein
MTRKRGLAVAAAIIARHVPNLGDLVLALDDAGALRLSAAVRNTMSDRGPAVVGGEARPDAAFWAAEARKVLG